MPVRYETEPLNLWSPLRRKLEVAPQSVAQAEQWVGLIRNFEKAGVSSTEIEWSSLLSFLQSRTGKKVTKETLLKVLSEELFWDLELVRQVNDDFTPSLNFQRLPEPPDELPVFIKDGIREQKHAEYRDRTFGLCINRHQECDLGLFGRHEYWTLSLPHGQRKFGFTAKYEEFGTIEEATKHAEKQLTQFKKRLAKEGFVGTTKSENEFESYHLPGGDNYTEWLLSMPNFPAAYWGPHFEYLNVVAHVRTTFRSNSKHQRILLIEEIQSDWNQSLRDIELDKADQEQLDNPPPENPYRNQWLETSLKAMLTLAARHQVSGIAWLPGKVHAQRFPWANAEGLDGTYDDVVRKAFAKLGKAWGLELQTTQIFPHENNLVLIKAESGTFAIYQKTPLKVVSSRLATLQEAEAIMAELQEQTEVVPILYMPEACRADIRNNGLPLLGSIGTRKQALVKFS